VPLSARAIYEEIRSHDDSFRLFCSIAAKGEAQGGWENARIAALCPDPELAPKIARHGADEDKHGRIFLALLHRRGLETAPVPAAADYCMLLERQGIGLAHERLREEQPLRDEELLAYLVHSRVTEQRAAEEVAQQVAIFGDDAELGKALRTIAQDEQNHLAYCHEQLSRFAAKGHAVRVRRLLREYALAEIRAYRDVSLEVARRMGEILGWTAAKQAVLAAGIRAIYAIERLWRWRRLTTLEAPRGPARSSVPSVGLLRRRKLR
jgi:rubrerythrin